MEFRRTVSGISNQHLFHNVDYVIFVEGGEECFTKDQIDQGKYSEISIDILFWKKLMEAFRKSSKFKFKAVGSKTTVLKIAEDIVENNLTTVYVAMDKEFDSILGKLFKHKNVLYTFGYSWENDAWSENLFVDLLKDLTAQEIDEEKLMKPFKRFLKDIKFAVYADSYLFSKSSSFFPRVGYMRLIECRLNKKTELKKTEVDSLILQKRINKSTIYSFGSKKKIKPRIHCFGHLYGGFCKHLLRYTLKVVFNLSGIGDELIQRMVISRYFDHMDKSTRLFYANQLK